jgi:hypothetical protein
MAIIPKLDSTPAHPQAGLFGRFQSELITTTANRSTNVELLITLRIDLEQRNPYDWFPFFLEWLRPKTQKIEDANRDPHNLFEIRDWKTDDWSTFRKAFLRYQKYWNGKFWLQSDRFAGLDTLPGMAGFRPNVYCRFQIKLVSPSDLPHRTIKVVRLNRKKGDSGTFRSDEFQYDNFDTVPRWYYVPQGRHVHRYYHLTIAHELGHALGMGEVGSKTVLNLPACVNATTPANYDAYCYGTKPSDWNNMMSHGHALTKANARPWLERIAKHTGTSPADWKVHMHRVYPFQVRGGRPLHHVK